MASTSSTQSLLLSNPLSPSSDHHHNHHRSKRASTTTVSAAWRNEAHDSYRGRRLVDESMIVLRKRIHEMRMIERNYEPPAHWMDWEKHCYAGYDEFICEAMGLLQTQLMNTRPGVVLGLVVLLSLSVPTSAAVVLSRLMDLTGGVLASVHFN